MFLIGEEKRKLGIERRTESTTAEVKKKTRFAGCNERI
jgi:hypothetical protein